MPEIFGALNRLPSSDEVTPSRFRKSSSVPETPSLQFSDSDGSVSLEPEWDLCKGDSEFVLGPAVSARPTSNSASESSANARKYELLSTAKRRESDKMLNRKTEEGEDMRQVDEKINFRHLKRLEKYFKARNAEGGEEKGRVDINEFCRALGGILGCSEDNEGMRLLFMKIDSNLTGYVDWNDYLSYMQMEFMEKDVMNANGGKELPFSKPLKPIKSTHTDTIVSIKFFQLLTNRNGNTASDKDNLGGRFLALSKEGQLNMYTLDLELVTAVTIQNFRKSLVSVWLTDLVCCANMSMFCISSTQREITFYDVSLTKVERVYQLIGFEDAILCMNYWFDYDDLNHAVLCVGDTRGTVYVFIFTKLLQVGFFNVNTDKGKLTTVSLKKFYSDQIPGAHLLTFRNFHPGWVKQVRFARVAQGFDCFLSCSATDERSMYVGDLSNMTLTKRYPGYQMNPSNRSHFYNVRKGINAIDYSPEWNIIATGGDDGVIRTWSPYNTKSASSCELHSNPVNFVRIIGGTGQLISFDTYRTMFLIELKDMTTVQSFRNRFFQKVVTPPNRVLEALMYHDRTKLLIMGAYKMGYLEKNDETYEEDSSMVRTHDGNASKVIYNSLFDQVITAGHDSKVSVWDFRTGAKIIHFTVNPGVEITCVALDCTQRRLVTGSRDGMIGLWNFNNGALLSKLCKSNGLEVTSIVTIDDKIVTAGWSRQICVYRDPASEAISSNDGPQLWQKVHEDDIQSLDHYTFASGVTIVASGSCDGDVYLWHLENSEVLARINRSLSLLPVARKQFHGEASYPVTAVPAQTEKLPKAIRVTSSLENARDVTWSQGSANRVIRGTDLPDITINHFAKESRLLRKSVHDLEPIPNEEFKTLLRPSAGGENKNELMGHPEGLTKQQVARRAVDIETRQTSRDYWKSDVSVDCVLFLRSRAHGQETATLLASGARGWVNAWSVHPFGGLIGQFVATRVDGDSVLVMTTNKSNSIVITGDTRGYVHIFDIEGWCCENNNKERREGMTDILQLMQDTPSLGEKEYTNLSSRRMAKLTTTPPRCVCYFRAHMESVTDLSYQEEGFFCSSTLSGNVRVWSRSGVFVGNFGGKFERSVPQLLSQPHRGEVKVPLDVKRCASTNTYFVLMGQQKVVQPEDKERVRKSEKANVERQYVDPVDLMNQKLPPINMMRPDDEINKNYEHVCKSMATSIVGDAYKPKRRHRMMPKIKLPPKSVQIHQALWYRGISDKLEIPAPGCLKEKWKAQKELNELRRGRPRRLAPVCTNSKSQNKTGGLGKKTSRIPTVKSSS